MTYGTGWWSALARVQSFQTLQDPLAPITPPYRRTPQLQVNAQRPVVGGDFSFLGEYVNFVHPSLVSGSRISLFPGFALPFTSASAYITPKVGVRFSEYDLRNNANNFNAGNNTFSVTVPTFSLDAGVTYERDVSFGGGKFIQTLEPRLYYLKVPYRNQSAAPNFDTAIADLNLMQVFSDNSYVGGDRTSDANQLTVAVSTRMIQADNGQERLRGTLGQRFYFDQQRVTLNSTTPARTERSDTVAALTTRLMDRLQMDASWQYNPTDGRTERTGVTVRYLPGLGKALNVGYQYNRNVLQNIDVSTQWPIGGNMSVVGRYNYSIQDGRILEGLGGVEYNGGCWVGRFVVQRYAVSTLSSTTALFVQLELNGLSKIGSNPLESLKRNIPGYSRINQPLAAEPGFSLYE